MLARATAKNTEQQIKQSEELSKQAEETARQGKTLMVFTAVTIIFVSLMETQAEDNPRPGPAYGQGPESGSS